MAELDPITKMGIAGMKAKIAEATGIPPVVVGAIMEKIAEVTDAVGAGLASATEARRAETIKNLAAAAHSLAQTARVLAEDTAFGGEKLSGEVRSLASAVIADVAAMYEDPGDDGDGDEADETDEPAAAAG